MLTSLFLYIMPRGYSDVRFYIIDFCNFSFKFLLHIITVLRYLKIITYCLMHLFIDSFFGVSCTTQLYEIILSSLNLYKNAPCNITISVD